MISSFDVNAKILLKNNKLNENLKKSKILD